MTLVTVAAQPGFLEALAGLLEENPLLTLIGWSLAVFGAGFASRKHFQDRELNRVKHRLLEVEQDLTAAKASLGAIETAEEEARSEINRIADCISPDEVKKHLASVLSHWSTEHHDLIVAGVIRQLLSTPGRAWVCTPSGSTLVKVDWDRGRGACRFGSQTNSSVDPVKELREFVRKPESLATVLLDLAIHGITSIAERTGPSELKVMKVRQGPGLGWNIETQVLERIPQ